MRLGEYAKQISQAIKIGFVTGQPLTGIADIVQQAQQRLDKNKNVTQAKKEWFWQQVYQEVGAWHKTLAFRTQSSVALSKLIEPTLAQLNTLATASGQSE